jgi:hypothetical protein
MTISARTSGPVLLAARTTFVHHVAEFSRAAARDDTQHFAVTSGNVIAKSFQIRRCKRAQRVGNRWHERRPLEIALEQSLDGLPRIGFGRVGDVDIHQRGLQRTVAQILLDVLRAHARFKQMRGIRMSVTVHGSFKR